MELQDIVDRYADCLEYVDRTSEVVASKRNAGVTFYQPGIQPMQEEVLLPLIDSAWEARYPGERIEHRTEVRYPTSTLPAKVKIDHLMTSQNPIPPVPATVGQPEWGIEVKRLQFVGDNGKHGDYEVAKVLSPYLKDRGMLHDALRLRDYGFTQRVAIIGYCFDYDSGSLAEAKRRHPRGAAAMTVSNIEKLVRTNGPLYSRPLIEFADSILRMRGWTVGPRAEASFKAWKHPSGGNGTVFGWEVRRERLEPHHDKRHPW